MRGAVAGGSFNRKVTDHIFNCTEGRVEGYFTEIFNRALQGIKLFAPTATKHVLLQTYHHQETSILLSKFMVDIHCLRSLLIYSLFPANDQPHSHTHMHCSLGQGAWKNASIIDD